MVAGHCIEPMESLEGCRCSGRWFTIDGVDGWMEGGTIDQVHGLGEQYARSQTDKTGWSILQQTASQFTKWWIRTLKDIVGPYLLLKVGTVGCTLGPAGGLPA